MKNKILPFICGALAVIAIAAGVARQPFYAAGPTLVQTGSSIASSDGTVTNTFTIAYSSAPKVFSTESGAALQSATNIITSVTTTNFVWKSQVPSGTNSWLAVGTP